jgi:hypothetical protein
MSRWEDTQASEVLARWEDTQASEVWAKSENTQVSENLGLLEVISVLEV